MTERRKDELSDRLEAFAREGLRAENEAADADDQLLSARQSSEVRALSDANGAESEPADVHLNNEAIRNVQTQRTLIPVLLTCGLLLPAVGALRWLVDEDSPFSGISVGVSISLICVGVAMLAVAVLLMRNVYKALANSAV